MIIMIQQIQVKHYRQKEDKMAKELNEGTKITLDLKTIGILLFTISVVIGMWFTLQSDIEEAKTLPEPPIDRIEYDLKDELIRQTILDTQDDVESILEELEKIDERLYELQKERQYEKFINIHIFTILYTIIFSTMD